MPSLTWGVTSRPGSACCGVEFCRDVGSGRHATENRRAAVKARARRPCLCKPMV